MQIDPKIIEYGTIFITGAAIGMYLQQRLSANPQLANEITLKDKEAETLKVVLGFLHAQTLRDLDLMCDLAHEDIVYINEPHPPERTIRGRKVFREVFADSPCIWCPEAKLEVLQYACKGDTVFVERLDQFFVDGYWIKVPICGYLKVKDGKVIYWKDYWCYKKYKDFVTEHYAPDFRLFRKTLKN